MNVPVASASPAGSDPMFALVLRELSVRAGRAGFAQQGECLEAATALLTPYYETRFPNEAGEMAAHARSCILAGAWESAALALIPAAAVVTCGRLADGAVIAQVVMPSGEGAHARDCRWLAMAILSALLLALATMAEAQDGATADGAPR